MSALLEDLTIDDDKDKEKLAKNALSALTTAESLLKSLLDISKLDSGSMKPDITRFPLQHILTAIDNEFTVLAAEKGLRFRVAPTSLGTKSDITLLRSVLLNFVSNAIRYTEKGSVMVVCRRHGENIRIEIRDSGIGIPEDKSATIFQEFQQLDESSEGAGLGLAICQRMAHLLGHEIKMTSSPGRGSCFSIIVPRCKAEAVKADTYDFKTYQKRWLEGIQILCVDDDREILNATHTVLERWGGQITCLHDANQFDEITMLDKNYDVVLMDYQLNDNHKGLDLLRKYRDRHDNFLGVIVTAEQDRQIEKDALSMGFKYLAKPVEPAKLRATLQAGFEQQPEGPGPFFHRAALHFRSCTTVHIAQCALPCEKMSAGDGHCNRVNRPYLYLCLGEFKFLCHNYRLGAVTDIKFSIYFRQVRFDRRFSNRKNTRHFLTGFTIAP